MIGHIWPGPKIRMIPMYVKKMMLVKDFLFSGGGHGRGASRQSAKLRDYAAFWPTIVTSEIRTQRVLMTRRHDHVQVSSEAVIGRFVSWDDYFSKQSRATIGPTAKAKRPGTLVYRPAASFQNERAHLSHTEAPRPSCPVVGSLVKCPPRRPVIFLGPIHGNRMQMTAHKARHERSTHTARSLFWQLWVPSNGPSRMVAALYGVVGKTGSKLETSGE